MARLLRRLFVLFVLLSTLFVTIVVLVYLLLVPKLPDATTLKDTELQTPLRLYTAEGLLMAEFGEQRRIPVEFEDIPEQIIHAFIAAEDERFFQHPGVDYQGLLRAAINLASTGEKAQGGSTITMQVARNFFLSREKTYLRKINEILLSLEIERILTKEEIMTLYLNKIFLGQRAYGIVAAAEVYYGKSLNDLTLAEAAMIAGLPKAPSTTNPITSPPRAKIRRDYVLRRMLDVGYINQQQFNEAMQEPVTARYHGRELEAYAPYAAEIVRAQLIEQYGEEIYTGGFNVYTTIRADQQKAAMDAVQKGLIAYDRRHGYRGPLAKVNLAEITDASGYEQALTEYPRVAGMQPAIVLSTEDQQATIHIRRHGAATLPFSTMTWARPYLTANSMGPRPEKVQDVLNPGDVVMVAAVENEEADHQWQLAQIPNAQAALVAVSPHDGAVTAIQGGFDFFHNNFNRATQSSRQPGSGFKPFIYSAALEQGYTAASIINDAPVVYDDPGLESTWRPENYSGRFFGPTRMREALIHSRNLVSIRVLRDIGINFAVDFSKRFGFQEHQLPRSLSLALGSGSASPLDMAVAYATIANGGYLIEPYYIHRIENSRGELIMQAQPATVCETCLQTPPDDYDLFSGLRPAERVISAQNAYIINSMLEDVIRHGTGRSALSLNRRDLAGKTGTTNNVFDAWFNGHSPELAAVSWIGFDTPQTLGRRETGGRAALPMWIDFMAVALRGVPDRPMQQPVDMVTVRIDPDTGLLARPGSANAIYETFPSDNVPQGFSSNSGSSRGSYEDSVPAIDLF